MLTILNPTRGYTPSATKVYVDVPETQSSGFRMRLEQDWKLRIWQEISDTNSHGGKVVFFTPTYNNENLPWFNYTEDGQSWCFPCFCKEHYEKFMRDFRGFFYRKYGLTGPNRTKAKYNRKGLPIYHARYNVRVIWPCEYGLDRSRTERAHYHPLLFIPEEYLACDELSSVTKIKNFIESLWTYGFVIWSKIDKGGIFVTRDFAATYVAKYCFKSAKYYTREDVRDFVFNSDGTLCRPHMQLLQGKLPTHWQSKFFGVGLCDLFDSYDKFRDGIDFNFDSNLQLGTSTKSRCPLYIERKLLCYVDKSDNSYKLNDKGIEWKQRKFEENLPKKSENLCFALCQNLSKYIQDIDVVTYLSHTTSKSVDGLRIYIQNLLNGRKWQELVLYNSVWKGLVCEDLSNLVALDDMSYDEFYSESMMQHYLELCRARGQTAYNPDGFFKVMRKQKMLNKVLTYNSCSRFEGFDELNSIYSTIMELYGSRCDARYLENLHRRKSLIMETG